MWPTVLVLAVFGASNVTPFALFLNATPQQVGWVSALLNLVGSVIQLFAVRLIWWTGGRLKLLARAVFAQAALLLCLSFLAYFAFAYQIHALILLLVLSSVCGSLAGPAWGSILIDYIPMHKRDFAWRSQMLGIVNVLSVICGGLLLYFTRPLSLALGFLFLFLTAACARFASGAYITQMVEPPTKRSWARLWAGSWPRGFLQFLNFLCSLSLHFHPSVAFCSTLYFFGAFTRYDPRVKFPCKSFFSASWESGR